MPTNSSLGAAAAIADESITNNPVFESDNHNIDMNDPDDGIARPNGWGRNHQVFGAAWFHSDMKDMAYYYIYKLYEDLVRKGILK